LPQTAHFARSSIFLWPNHQCPFPACSHSIYESWSEKTEWLSPENFISGFGKTAGNYLSPEFLEFLRAELLRCGKALRTVAPALGHDNEDVKEQAHLAATAQFFYALGTGIRQVFELGEGDRAFPCAEP